MAPPDPTDRLRPPRAGKLILPVLVLALVMGGAMVLTVWRSHTLPPEGDRQDAGAAGD